ncbi:hypothetical protein QP162_22935 [Sphingomonas aurantiaca]|uniref:hypothetical protein n=1 Tax=Sphingomonas aurantiaca TaxID=185949 RepID=UPI002FDF984B
MNTLFDWIEANPAWLMHLIRPNDIEGLFGKDYRAIAGNAAKAKVALPQIRPLLTAWMAGKPLCEPRTCDWDQGASHQDLRDCAALRGSFGSGLGFRRWLAGTHPCGKSRGGRS